VARISAATIVAEPGQLSRSGRSIDSFGQIEYFPRRLPQVRCNSGSSLVRLSLATFSAVLTPDFDLQKLFALSSGVRSRVTNKSSKSLILGPRDSERSESVVNGEPLLRPSRTSGRSA
jgi:hypothetical protein